MAFVMVAAVGSLARFFVIELPRSFWRIFVFLIFWFCTGAKWLMISIGFLLAVPKCKMHEVIPSSPGPAF